MSACCDEEEWGTGNPPMVHGARRTKQAIRASMDSGRTNRVCDRAFIIGLPGSVTLVLLKPADEATARELQALGIISAGEVEPAEGQEPPETAVPL